MADSIFSQAGFDIPSATAPPAAPVSAPTSEPAVASPSMFEAAGFKVPDKDSHVDALEDRIGADHQKSEAKPGRGIWQAIKDYPGHVLGGMVDTAKLPGTVMTENPYKKGSEEWQFFEDSRRKAIEEGGPALAGMVTTGELPKAGVIKVAEKVAPSTRAVNALVEAVGPENVPSAVNRLQQNPRLTLADVSDPVRTMAQGLIDPAQPKAQNAIVDAVKARAATRLEAANTAFTEAMGPKPDVMGMVDKLRERASMTTPKTDVRASLDDILGRSIDPHSSLQKMLKEREAANPLYEKAMSNPVAWDERLQQFIDDPIVKSGIAKGVRIQRLESLAENKPFKPSDYAIKDFDEAGNPVLGETPNMRTLNVVKKGLDAMVEGGTDAVTGKLSEEGRAVNGVRKAFLKKLDDINPDYKAAREAWAGPTKVQEAFDRGLNLFQNRAGSSGVKTTPEALAAWFENASDSEKQAAQHGARAAFEQQMRSSGDPAAKAGVLANKEVNQDKLATIFGKEASGKIVDRLNYAHEDPIHTAFDKGFDVLKNRSGVSGIEDRPEVFRKWLDTATPEQVVATRLGVRADIDQKINSVKNGALKGETITAIPYNQEKLRSLFGDKEANRLIRVMKDSADEAHTNAKLLAGAKTAETQAGQRALEVPKVEPFQLGSLTHALLPGTLAEIAGQYMGSTPGLTAAGLVASGLTAGTIKKGVQNLKAVNALSRNAEFAKRALATGSTRQETVNALLSHPKVVRELQKRSNALAAP